MSALAKFLMSVFGELVKALGIFVTKKAAMNGAAIAIILVLLATFYAAMKLLVAGIVYQIDNQYILTGFYLIWPPNAELCISTYFAARLTLFLYREYRANVHRAMQ